MFRKQISDKLTSIEVPLSAYDKKTSHYHIMITRQNIKTNFQDKKASLLIKVNGTSVKISKQTYEISKRILDHQLAES